MSDHIANIMSPNVKASSSQRRRIFASYVLNCCLVFFLAAPALFLVENALAADARGRVITSVAVAVNPVTHKVYTVDEDANSVVVADESTGSTHRVEVGKAPIAIAVLPSVNKAYVVNTGSDRSA